MKAMSYELHRLLNVFYLVKLRFLQPVYHVYFVTCPDLLEVVESLCLFRLIDPKNVFVFRFTIKLNKDISILL